MKTRSNTLLACAIAAAAVAAALEAQTSAVPKPRPGSATAQPATEVHPAFGENVLEITPGTLDRFAKALAAEESSRKTVAAKVATPKPQPQKTKKEYQECRQGVMAGPEYAQLMQEYAAAASGQSKNTSAAHKAGSDMMAKLAALIETTCGTDPGRSNEKKDVTGELRRTEKAAAESNGFTLRQYAILKERVTPLCLSDPVPPDPAGLKLKGQGSASFVYTAAEVAALRPRCDAFVRLLYPEQN
ncbi:MAG: hypothetical protein LAO05_11450 [Acidobacteriia bacterium]|nr:hypothetical protein [Terriglobia bacterium]